MSRRRRLHRLVPGAAVVAVTVAALGTAWLGSGQDAAPAPLAAAERPSLSAAQPEVVRGPVRMQPASCRDCAVPAPAPGGHY